MTKLQDMLIRHEGLRLKPYEDTFGNLTIGVGRNLDDYGIDNDEALILLNNDIARVTKQCVQFEWYWKNMVFNENARADVIKSMIFNLGLEGFKKFKAMISALELKNYDLAADEMLNSEWAKQVGDRAIELASMMKTGSY